MSLRDAKGKTLVQNDDTGQNRDALLNYTIRADGQYEMVIQDVHRHGGPRYVYRLTAVEVAPDFALSVAADSFVAANGKPLTIAVKVARRDGFAGRIEVQAVDLPDGITCAPVVSPPKGKTAAAVNLSIEATGKGISAPIRIVGKSLDAPKFGRTATVAVLSGAANMSSLWLTIPR